MEGNYPYLTWVLSWNYTNGKLSAMFCGLVPSSNVVSRLYYTIRRQNQSFHKSILLNLPFLPLWRQQSTCIDYTLYLASGPGQNPNRGSVSDTAGDFLRRKGSLLPSSRLEIVIITLPNSSFEYKIPQNIIKSDLTQKFYVFICGIRNEIEEILLWPISRVFILVMFHHFATMHLKKFHLTKFKWQL